MSKTKINRAMKLAKTGKYPETFTAMLAHMPSSLLERLTAGEIAMSVDALFHCAQYSKTIALRDVIHEGGIWDNKSQKFRRLEK